MNKWILAAVTLLALNSADAVAENYPVTGCKGPFCNHQPRPYYGRGQTLPVYMAAPWYLYWPYDAHFMTPAPLQGAYYAPPMMGNYPAQPYFPSPVGPPYGNYPAFSR